MSTGCSGSSPELKFPAQTTKEPDLAKGASIGGVVTVSGDVPERKLLTINDSYCSGRGTKVYDEVWVSKDGKLANVLVWIRSGLESYTFEWDKTNTEIDQKDCIFVPHILVARQHQPIVFKNSDGTSHNVNTQSARQTTNAYNFSVMPNGGTSVRQFPSVEMGVKVRCDVHPNMLAYLFVMEHPYTAVTDAEGKWSFPRKLPPGTYVLAAWHEKAGTLEEKLVVGEDGSVTVPSFTFKVK